MNRYNKILVAADINSEQQPALARAIQLAKKDHSTSEIVFFLTIYDFSYEMTSMLSGDERDAMRHGVIEQREDLMNNIIEPYLSDDVSLTVKVTWHNRPYEAIIEEVFAGDYDILIKATHKHDTLESVIFTPTDWHLLRKCPTPVLLVKDHDWEPNGNIVASVHVGSENETHHSLNQKMVSEAIYFGEMLNATPHLVNAYPSTPANITVEIPEFDPGTYSDAVRGHHLTAMKALRQQYGICDEQTHVEEGITEDVISQVAKKLDADLVILGTTGRTGLSAVFIGNTAEHTIDMLNCDVLALKPDGFLSPLDPEIN